MAEAAATLGSVSGVDEDKANKFGEVIFYNINKFVFAKKYLSKSKFVKLYYYHRLK